MDGKTLECCYCGQNFTVAKRRGRPRKVSYCPDPGRGCEERARISAEFLTDQLNALTLQVSRVLGEASVAKEQGTLTLASLDEIEAMLRHSADFQVNNFPL